MSTAEVETVVEVEMEDEQLEGSDGNFEGGEYELITASEGEDNEADEQLSEAVTPVSNSIDGNTAADDHDLLLEILDAEKNVATREAIWNAAKEVAKARKADYEEAVLELRSRIRQADEKYPLFDKPKDKAGKGGQADSSNDNAGLAGEGVSTVEVPPGDESWREVQLEHLSIIKESTLAKLYGADIETVGDLTDYQSAGKQLTDIAGIGPAKVDQISDAMEEFWKNWNAGQRFNVAASTEDQSTKE
jgi:hypothetical protein